MHQPSARISHLSQQSISGVLCDQQAVQREDGLGVRPDPRHLAAEQLRQVLGQKQGNLINSVFWAEVGSYPSNCITFNLGQL